MQNQNEKAKVAFVLVWLFSNDSIARSNNVAVKIADVLKECFCLGIFITIVYLCIQKM